MEESQPSSKVLAGVERSAFGICEYAYPRKMEYPDKTEINVFAVYTECYVRKFSSGTN